MLLPSADWNWAVPPAIPPTLPKSAAAVLPSVISLLQTWYLKILISFCREICKVARGERKHTSSLKWQGGATRCGCFSGWILTTLQPCREVMKSYTSTNEMFGVDVRVLFCTLYCLPTQQDQTWQGLNSLVRLWVPVASCTTHDRAGDQEQSNVFTMWGFKINRGWLLDKGQIGRAQRSCGHKQIDSGRTRPHKKSNAAPICRLKLGSTSCHPTNSA